MSNWSKNTPPIGDILYFLVLSNPTEGDDEAFNDWYTNQHNTDVIDQVPGVLSIQRFRLSGPQRRPPPHAYRYLCIYRVERARGDEVFAKLQSLSGTAAMPVSETFAEDHLALVYEPVTDRLLPGREVEPG
jgi:hypothetical protein